MCNKPLEGDYFLYLAAIFLKIKGKYEQIFIFSLSNQNE